MDVASQPGESGARCSRLSRRAVLAGLLLATVPGCMRTTGGGSVDYAQMRRWNAIYGPLTNEPYAIPAVSLREISPAYLRQRGPYATSEPPGTIVVDPSAKYLYLVQGNGEAWRYGIGVGREGYSWSGSAIIGAKKKWPTWTPPVEMIAREPELGEFIDGMPPGLENPLGARALYLHEDGRDTLYRLHGTAQTGSIGRAVSSGCIRLLNHDIIDLYERVGPGTRVVVLGAGVQA